MLTSFGVTTINDKYYCVDILLHIKENQTYLIYNNWDINHAVNNYGEMFLLGS